MLQATCRPGRRPLNPAKRLRRRSHRDRSRQRRLQTSSFASRVVGARVEVAKGASCERGTRASDVSSVISLPTYIANQFPEQAVDDSALTRF